VKPRDGVGYRTLKSVAVQADQAASNIGHAYKTGQGLLVSFNALLEQPLGRANSANTACARGSLG